MSQPNFQPYNLATPTSLSPRSVERLDALREVLAERVRLSLRQSIRTGSQVAVSDIQLKRPRDLSQFAEGKAWWYSGGPESRASDKSVLVGATSSLIYSAIDRILGGSGESEPPGRVPSQLEMDLGQAFLLEMFHGLQDALSKPPLGLRVAAGTALKEPLRTFLTDLDNVLVCWEITVTIDGSEHILLLGVSRGLVEETVRIDDALDADPSNLSGDMKSATTSLVAELARCRLTVEEAADLEPGDILVFDAVPGQLVELKVQGKRKFRGRLGVHDGFYAVEVKELFDRPREPQAPKKEEPRPKNPKQAENKAAKGPRPARGRKVATHA